MSSNLFISGACLLLVLSASSDAAEEQRTLAEWERIITVEDLQWRSSGRGGRDEYVDHLTTLASKRDALGKAESQAAAFKLGTYYLKMKARGHEDNLLAWHWYREAGGDDHALAQLALGYVFVSLAEEYAEQSHFDEIKYALERIGEPGISALEKAAAREEDPSMKRAAAHVLHDVRKKMEGRK